MQDPSSPCAEGPTQSGKQPKKSKGASPSMLGLSPMASVAAGGDGPPLLELPPALGEADAYQGKVPVPAPVPAAPPDFNSSSIASQSSGIGLDEMYSEDEKLLNEFLKLHPMLSNEATSQRTLQALAGMFEKASLKSVDLPVVGKSHDDQFLSPPNEAIGERTCINGANCLAQHVAKMRYGVDTDKAFTCKEFLLPHQLRTFLDGHGLPQRRGKCLMCCRYYQNYTYIIVSARPRTLHYHTPAHYANLTDLCWFILAGTNRSRIQGRRVSSGVAGVQQPGDQHPSRWRHQQQRRDVVDAQPPCFGRSTAQGGSIRAAHAFIRGVGA